MTFSVLKLTKLIEINDEHIENILSIFLIFFVLKLDKSIDCKVVQKKNNLLESIKGFLKLNFNKKNPRSKIYVLF